MNNLEDSEVQSLRLSASQMTHDGFEKLPQVGLVSRNTVKSKAAIRSQVLNQGRVYEAQAFRAEHLLRMIDSAQVTV